MGRFRQRALALGFIAVLLGSAAPSSAATNVMVNQNSNHRTIVLKRGTSLTLSLNSTYWTIRTSYSSRVVTPVGKTTVKSIFPGPTAPLGCKVPGMGCGTVMHRFKATSVGRTSITASRTTCGEAMLCAPDKRNFAISVVVIN
jgi:hypothetical protein